MAETGWVNGVGGLVGDVGGYVCETCPCDPGVPCCFDTDVAIELGFTVPGTVSCPGNEATYIGDFVATHLASCVWFTPEFHEIRVFFVSDTECQISLYLGGSGSVEAFYSGVFAKSSTAPWTLDFGFAANVDCDDTTWPATIEVG